MKKLIDYIKLKTSLSKEDSNLIEGLFTFQKAAPNTLFLCEGNVERYVYFLNSGVVKGYRNIGGKIIVEQLIEEGNFFSSFESFMQGTPAQDNFESITECEVYKISKPGFVSWKSASHKWSNYVQDVINDHLNCKIQRVRDFQTLSAKERYIKFVENYPKLALQVKVETIASFLGLEPQSLSRIRRQLSI